MRVCGIFYMHMDAAIIYCFVLEVIWNSLNENSSMIHRRWNIQIISNLKVNSLLKSYYLIYGQCWMVQQSCIFLYCSSNPYSPVLSLAMFTIFLTYTGHIFFDDAMTPYDNPEDESTVNDFVKRLVRVMDDAARWAFIGTDLNLSTLAAFWRAQPSAKNIKKIAKCFSLNRD